MAEPNPLRVLIADDEPLAAERLQLLLARAEGAQLVGTASDGDSAINLTEALHPDLLLLDIAMPGRALARRPESLAGGSVRDGVRSIRRRRLRSRGRRLFDEAG
jgi:DNA-binding NarL/FixJ family response regulator